MRYKLKSALSIKGDRHEKGSEIELTAEEAARFDPADITSVDSIPEPEPEEDLSAIGLEDMSHEQLKARAKELGLKASGSKADLQERITLHLEGVDADEAATDEDLEESN